MRSEVKHTSKTGQNEVLIGQVKMACRDSRDVRGELDYRSVFAVGESDFLYVDVEIFNCRINIQGWSKEIKLKLYRWEGKKWKCVAEKQGNVEVGEKVMRVIYAGGFAKTEMPEERWLEGKYKVMAEIAGIKNESDDIFFIEGNGQPDSYFKILKVGIDRVCEEADEVAEKRVHSFKALKLEGLKDVRFLFMAYNLINHEWIYEFVIKVYGEDGRLKAQRMIKAAQFIRDASGNSLLCFGVDLGAETVGEGHYSLSMAFAGHILLHMNFSIGGEDIPYDFTDEITQSLGQTVVKNTNVGDKLLESKDDVMNSLYHLVGLRKVKEEITRMVEYAEFVALRHKYGLAVQSSPLHLIFTGHPGIGKNTIADIIGKLFVLFGVLRKSEVHSFKRNDFVQEGAAVEERLVRRAIQMSEGGIMLVEEAGDLFDSENREDRGVVALGVLYSILLHEHPDVLVILSDSDEEMDGLLEAFPDLGKLFQRRLWFEDYTPEELLEIARRKLEGLQYSFTPAAEEKFYKQLQAACVANEVDFTDGYYIDGMIEEAVQKMSKRLMANRKDKLHKQDLMLLEEEDISGPVVVEPEKILEKLKGMVGMEKLKKELLQHLNYVYFIRERQKLGFADILPPLNMFFCGNPGTGKTTVVKMLGDVFHAAGILARPDVLIQDARYLVAENGMQPLQVAGVLTDSAAGGILYISHANVLTDTEFGVSVLEGILSTLSVDECGNTIVVLGGETESMQLMIKKHPGLSEYFPYIFYFDDYTPEELMAIAIGKLKDKSYIFHPKAKEKFLLLIRNIYERREKYFKNVLLIENIIEQIIHNMSNRTMKIRDKRGLTRQEMTTIRQEDIPDGILSSSVPDQPAFDEQAIQDALADLSQLVGQTEIKKQLGDFVELARHYRQEGVDLAGKMSLQWCFTGNSAMGKGTVARIIARLYKAMGIVDTEQVVVFKVERLIGTTEEEAQQNLGEVLKQSERGVLLFDEDSPKLAEAMAFRERVHALFMSRLAENPGKHLIIYAVPRTRLADLNSDAERMSEVVNILDFQNYSRDELMLILKRRLQKENMKMTATARQYMYDFIGSMVSTGERSQASSRLMRIVADLIVRNCLQRVAKNISHDKADALISVQKQDVAMFTESFIAGIMKERKRVGFV